MDRRAGRLLLCMLLATALMSQQSKLAWGAGSRHKKIRRISFCPGLINDLAEPRLLSQGEPEFQDVVAYMQKWCKELGTEVEGDGVVVLPHEQGL
ncbi:MAG: hypothetical protein HYY45_20325 [Deltaproteobacteria bacterium]|nr:hypothetical protein [Deltaproteobacteria bacterium]